ncbi:MULTISPECIES: hypothetical protein [Leuconostoc]|uniref:Uncharacterized protein n=1 Tax=Leuconostoc inhae TaxID=178001 RepID=A0AAN2UEA2_9LACO|nr:MULTISPECIES: hypothetical protein [Leuconostoc]MBZ5947140.1 plantaricin NC8 alpha peptide precursor [Leuconostoc gasicomitatum]MBZ5955023.1 plantaricin NC8 alpha peptide precursor [Leuconostoc gasicomitatum]MBZ5956189.1 plantaricin NC8 alpha peptide precursor [Leuconostoc gasicomitatum]MBZ5959401.1 plantaricin NC8 alpha peptide precursor [Leuconostoc gasicomitatum]MBZ5960014.1 plantaricin NC8 alpha peptide precursor [Leuconostoc gasicomitatum]
MYKYKIMSNVASQNISGGALLGNMWHSFGYTLGRKTNWNLKHPHASNALSGVTQSYG